VINPGYTLLRKATAKGKVRSTTNKYSRGKSTLHRGLLGQQAQRETDSILERLEIYSPSTQIGKYSHLSPSTQIGKYNHLQLRLASTQIGKYIHLQLRLENIFAFNSDLKIYSPSTQIGKYIRLQLRLENIFAFNSDWKIYSPSTQIGKYIHLQLRLENIFTFNSASLSRLRLMALAPNIFPLLAKTWKIYQRVPPWEKVKRYPNSDSRG
jgi:hypothetical protein